MRTATVSLDPFTLRTIGGAGPALDRLQWFGVHTNDAPSSSGWRPEDVAEFSASGYRAHPGRSFFVSSRMQEGGVVEDAARPGFVDVPSLLASCAAPAPLGWPVGEVDMVVSSKPDQLYNNSCQGATGQAPKGFMPGSHAATAEFFALFYEHCMPATAQPRVLMEVANECDVKTGAAACDTTWDEMVALHVAVGDAVHAAHANASAAAAARAAAGAAGASPPPRPLVCGPTAAFPEYQLNDFVRWRPGGQFAEFVAKTAGTSGGNSGGGNDGGNSGGSSSKSSSPIDCLSIHFYSTYGGSAAGPFSSNYSSHEGGNLLASLDLQEAATAAARGGIGGGGPLPLLVSEYGAGFKAQPLPYRPEHDYWVLREVNAKLMSFMDRPDRILKALPFIVDKASWDQAGMADNASASYPFVLWRNVSGSDASNFSWAPTHLHKFYAAWRDVDGERFAAQSDDANVQVQAFATASNWTVALNNLNHTGAARVALAWPALPAGCAVDRVTVRRLFWDASAGAPALTDAVLAPGAALPASVVLNAADLVIVAARFVASGGPGLRRRAAPAATSVVDVSTLHSARLLAPLASSPAAAANASYVFALRGATPARVRVSVGGPESAREAAFAALRIVVNGAECAVDPGRQVGGQPHFQPKDGSFLTAIEVPVPAAAAVAAAQATVEVWSAAAGGLVVSTVAMMAHNMTHTAWRDSTLLPDR
jgi:hypothetical protein